MLIIMCLLAVAVSFGDSIQAQAEQARAYGAAQGVVLPFIGLAYVALRALWRKFKGDKDEFKSDKDDRS